MKKYFMFLKNVYFSVPAGILLLLVGGGFLANCFISNTYLLDNRPLAQKPTKLTSHFSKDYETYFNETFAGRKKFVKKFAKIKMRLGFDSGYTINGLNGWMFYDSAKVPDGYTLVDYYGEVSFSPEEEKIMAEGMQKAHDFYAKRGIDYVVAVVPNKEGMYSEFMPVRMQKARVSDVSRSDKAISYTQQHTKVDIINWRESLMNAKSYSQYQLYYSKDSHWNNVGAYVAYYTLAQKLLEKGYDLQVEPFENEMVKSTYPVHSDLTVAGEADEDYELIYKPEQNPQNPVNEDHGFFQIWENPSAPVQKRVLLIRDSMGLGLMRYMVKDFAYGVYAHSKWNTKEGLHQLIETYHPDLVIDETGERYFTRFLKYNDIYAED